MSKVVDFSKYQDEQHTKKIMDEISRKVPSYMMKSVVVNGKVEDLITLEGLIHFLHVTDNPTIDSIDYLYYIGYVVGSVMKYGKYSSEGDEFHESMADNQIFQLVDNMVKCGFVYGKKI